MKKCDRCVIEGWPHENGSLWEPIGGYGHGGPHWKVHCTDMTHYLVTPGTNPKPKKKKSEVIFICERTIFYSLKDEDLFFEWIDGIACIEKISSVVNELYLHVVSGKVSIECLRELIGLFRRYAIDMEQLTVLLNNDNQYLFNEFSKH